MSPDRVSVHPTMRSSIVVLALVIAGGCAGLGGSPFDVHDGTVTFTDPVGRRHPVVGADASTFEHVGGPYGRDASRVYLMDDAVEGADSLSFEYLGGIAGRDAKMVFVGSAPCTDCDWASFRHLKDNWYADHRYVYEGARRRPDIDRETFQPLNFWYAKDGSHVLLGGKPIPGADAPSFGLASCGCDVCGEDRNRCYWYGHPVPCDCAPHTLNEFAFPPAERTAGQALLATTHPISVDSAPLTPAFHGFWGGYWRIDAGRRVVPLRCWDKDHSELLQVTIDFQPARIYRISQRKGAACEVEVEPTALVQGRIDGPEIRIRLGDDSADRSWRAPEDLPGLERDQPLQSPPRSRVELAPGPHSLTAVCRRVTRTEVLEGYVAIDVSLETGRIYQLDADFDSPDYRCLPRIAIVDDTEVLPARP